jgi:DNA adenine methylase
MRYLGGKARQAAHLSKIIASIECARYVEPFLGGASIAERVVPSMRDSRLSDAHPDLMLMWQALVDGWVPPGDVSREEYTELRRSEPSALRGLVGFGASFGGKWFGGYGVDKADAKHPGGPLYRAGRAGALRKAAALRDAGAVLACRSYADLDPGPGDLVYCDPPYAGTTAYDGLPEFDHAAFWGRVREWALSGASILVSEYRAPWWARTVWSRPSVKSLRRDQNDGAGTEHLFAVGGSLGFGPATLRDAS